MTRARCGDSGARIADVSYDGHASFDLINRKLEQRALFRVGKTHRLAGVHGKRKRLCAIAQVECNHFLEQAEVDLQLRRERRNGRMH